MSDGNAGETPRKRPWLAVLLAVVYPGLGHVYLRAWGRALLWFAVIIASTSFLIPEAAVPDSLSLDAVITAAEAMPLDVSLFVLALSLLSVLDAYWLATRVNEIAGPAPEAGTSAGSDDTTGPGDCPHCGKELDGDLDFCPWCTERLVDADDDSTPG